ncbi:hypothetical protein AM500_17400 [Bacillus sp. FJAT-18017]|uniref:hypothetical protein n=1 Tax=Bacillus sp. FJAT-18017 TaxID=1705566 RepID=UPI0006AEEE18|nr:hypothetical protein [Bacillus sp. FJAT-18017]ALC91376.1 hypothetical protein AM500_17400 [Bacillus sp. FJAT-18017]
MIALVDKSKQMNDFVDFTNFFRDIGQLMDEDLLNYKFIFINGNDNGVPLKLPYELVEKLWDFVDNGGILYGEMINCDDFPTSRLFGFKQDFNVTNRRLEKLVISKDSDFCKKGQLLEWHGPFITGFAFDITFDIERLMDIGHFRETHSTEATGDYPAIIAKKHGEGKAIYSAISFLGNEQSWTLRPNWLWNDVINWLKSDYQLPIKDIQPIIELSKNTDIEKNLEKGVNWFLTSGILPKDDGSLGVYENVHSIRSEISKDLRPDCHAHTALLFYLYGEYTKEKKWTDLSANLLAYLFEEGYQDTDPDSVTYGFWKWFQSPKKKPDQIFSDDNGWVALVLLYLYRKTGKEEYKERGLLTAYALLNTQNKNGLRPECIREKELLDNGTSFFKNSTAASMNPHFESIVHAAFIQAYIVSKDERFKQAAYQGSLELLKNKENLKYMYSKTAGYSRFLLSLTQMYAISKDETIRRGLDEVIEYLSANQHEQGGIEESDNPDPERYGFEDTGVFQFNNEGIADQLYTNNFLVMNAWEASKATGDPAIKDLHEKLVSFISDIQITSAKKEFDGGWMRSFHLERGEYFGNNGDTGWGAYVIESGWTNAIILSGLLLSEMNQSLLD